MSKRGVVSCALPNADNNSESLLAKKLLKLFPNNTNMNKGSIYYDYTKSDNFKIVFGGDWQTQEFKDKNADILDKILDENGEPRIYDNAYYITAHDTKLFIAPEQQLSSVERASITNSIMTSYITSNNKSNPAKFTRDLIQGMINEAEKELQSIVLNDLTTNSLEDKINNISRRSEVTTRISKLRGIVDSKTNVNLIAHSINSYNRDLDIHKQDIIDTEKEAASQGESSDVYGQERNEVSYSNNMESEIKKFFHSIPLMNVDIQSGEAIYNPILDPITKLPLSLDNKTVEGRLISITANMVEQVTRSVLADGTEIQIQSEDLYDQMLNKLKEVASESGDYILNAFVEQVDNYTKGLSSINKRAFQVKFVKSFHLGDNNFTYTEVSTRDGLMTIKHIDPSSTQDSVSKLTREYNNGIFNKYLGKSIDKIINRLMDENITAKELRAVLSELDIEVSNQTLIDLIKNKDNLISEYDNSSLKKLAEVFKQSVRGEYTSKEGSNMIVTGISNILTHSKDLKRSQQSDILKTISDKRIPGLLQTIAKYEANNKSEISDNSLYVGSKQRWMYSMISKIKKDVFIWQSLNANGYLIKDNLQDLINLKDKGIHYVDYLLAKDISTAENITDEELFDFSKLGDPSNKRLLIHHNEIKRRLEGLRIINNTEIKVKNENEIVDHKSIGIVDIHMDDFFKLFNFDDNIHDTTAKENRLSLRTVKTAFGSYKFGADKGTSMSIEGIPDLSALDIKLEEDRLSSLGNYSDIFLKQFYGEYTEMIDQSRILGEYLSLPDNKAKFKYAANNLIPGYHFSDNKGKFLLTEDNLVTEEMIKGGTWNKLGIFNGILREELTPEIKSILTPTLGPFLETGVVKMETFRTLIDNYIIAKIQKDVDSINKIKAEVDFEGNISRIFDRQTNIKNSSDLKTVYKYSLASLVNNINMMSLFNGNVAFYKQSTSDRIDMMDVLKRGPQVMSDGIRFSRKPGSNIKTYTNMAGEEVSYNSNTHATVAVYQDLNNAKSKHRDLISKGLGKDTDYGHIIADASGLSTLDHFMDLIESSYGLTEGDYKHYEDLSDPNHKVTKSDIEWLKTAGRATSPLKVTGASLINHNINTKNNTHNMQYPMFLKYSVAVLAPAVVAGSNLESLLDTMTKQGVDQVVAKSGSKDSNPMVTNIANYDADGIFTGLNPDMVLNPITFPYADLKIQTETPNKFNKVAPIGNQHVKNLIANFLKSNDFNLDDSKKVYDLNDRRLTAKEMYDEFNDSANGILQAQLNNFLKDISYNEKTGKFNEQKFRDMLIAQLDPVNDLDFINTLSDASIPLEGIPGVAQRGFPIISKYIHKNVGKILTNTAVAVQVANIGYDRILQEDKSQIIWMTQDRDLKPPVPVTNDNGDILYFNNEGASSTVENEEYHTMKVENAKVLLPFQDIYNITGMSVAELKAKLKQDPDFLSSDIFKSVIGYRIPNQSISSNDAIEIVGILPPSAGDQAILYNEITEKTGSDFDIDKMYLMMPTLDVVKDNKGDVYRVILNKNLNTDGGRQNRFILAMKAILNSGVSYDDLMSPLDNPMIKDSILKQEYASTLSQAKAKEFIINNSDKTVKQLKESDPKFSEFIDNMMIDPIEQMTSHTMAQSRVDMLQAKTLVATMANHMTDISMSQISNTFLDLGLGLSNIHFSKMFVNNKEGESDFKLTKVVSYLMNSAVDAAKDNFIIRGNFNSYTANAAMVLFRLGYPADDVFSLLMNPHIKEYSDLKQISTQQFADIKGITSQKDLNDLSAKYIIANKDKPIDLKHFIGDKATREDALGLWNILMSAGKELNNNILSSKFDSSGAGNNIYDHLSLFNRLERAKRERIRTKDSNGNTTYFGKLYKNGIEDPSNHGFEFQTDLNDYTFLGSMMNNSLLLTNKIVKTMFLEATPKYVATINEIAKQLNNDLPTSSDDIKSIASSVYPTILSYSGNGIYKSNMEQNIKLLNEFPARFMKLKKHLPNNAFLNQIYIDPNSGILSFPNYRNFEGIQKLNIKDSVEEIYSLINNKNVNIGNAYIKDLIKYSYLTTGFKPTFFTFNEFLPKSYFIINDHVRDIKRLLDNFSNNDLADDKHVSDSLKLLAFNNSTNFKYVKRLYGNKVAGFVKDGVAITDTDTMKKVTNNNGAYEPFISVLQAGELRVMMYVGNNGDNPVYRTINTPESILDNTFVKKLYSLAILTKFMKNDELVKKDVDSTTYNLVNGVKNEYNSDFDSFNLLESDNNSLNLQESNNNVENILTKSKTMSVAELYTQEEWDKLSDKVKEEIIECN